MPNTSEGFDQVEASASPEHAVNVVKFESVQSDPAPRRRRGGRRVVRGVGAAGASLELKVEEHASAPLFEEPKLPVAQPAHDTGDSADSEGMIRPTRRRRRPVQSDDDVREIADERPTRSRRRRSVQVEDEQDEDRPSRRRSRFADDADEYDEMPRRRASVDDSHDEESSVERALDAVDMLPEGHEVRHNPRPMMSLLFQEPVLPSVADSRDRADDDRDDSRNDRGERNDRNAQDHDDEQDEDRPSRRRRRRNRDVANEERSEDNRNERDNRDNRNDDADNDEEGGSRKSRRSRRLNAQERRAAAEVEQIEEDLILDDITYAPIDDETRNRNDDDDDEQPTRTRRRRRSRGNREEADEQQRDSDEGESRRRREDDDEDEGTVTRRRRRRRGGAKTDETEEPLVRRSRKQQYIDEITDVEGSTRLEAKKQRRRDNRRERSRQSQLMEQDFLARREHVDRLMVVRERERHTQISVIEDNVLVEHYVSDIQEVATVGNIYLGRVQNVLPSMEAAFVDIGQARNGVLYAGEVNWDSARLEGQPRRIELAFKSGDPVLVQVTKDPIGHKGARLTSQVTLAGRFLVLVPSGGMTGVSRKLSERERSRLKKTWA